jgi:two-component system, cell cycle sensor histidine kinase and response regulator CckA
VDVNAIVGEMEKLLRRIIGEDIVFETESEPAPARVKADPGQLEQVLMNLAVNARDAMPRGGRLTIRTSNVELAGPDALALAAPPGRYVLLAVADSGTGMDAETQSRIFEPFFTTKDANKGTGLGLSTVYGIVQQSAGFLSLSSEPGKGTTFRIYLPHVDAAAPPSPGRTAGPAGAAHHGTGTILLAEDESAIRSIMRKVLARNGYQLIEAASGEEALECLATHAGSVDLLISDVVMPGLNGPELAARLRTRFPALRVLYLSGYTDLTMLDRELARGRVAFLPKPFTPSALTEKVRQVLASPDNP